MLDMDGGGGKVHRGHVAALGATVSMDMDKLTLTPLALAETPDEAGTTAPFDAAAWLPRGVGQIRNHQTDLPRIAKDAVLTKIERCPRRPL
jgi:hypothetical protein